ncbi:MAG: hypothetical protein FJY80_05990 [Candidatus Aminicenantes bacterium]|nr:hypothetical protein [Candidatus Aminicenantes bacterium]
MNGPRPSLFTPALVGGAAAGLLSAIPVVNCLCCLWIIGGGALAAHLWAKNNPRPLTSGEGALVGAYAGLIATVIDFLISLPLAAVNAAFFRRVFERLSAYVEEMPAGWERLFDRTGPFEVGWFLFGLVVAAFIFSVLGALGGVLGHSLFGRRSQPAAPQPPVPPPSA